MKILQVLLSPRIGGAEALVDALSLAWVDYGAECRVHYLDPPNDGPRSRHARISLLSRAIRAWEPDIIVSHSALPNTYARLAARGSTPVITVLHSATDDFADRSLRWAERVLRPVTAKVVAVSQSQADEYSARFGRRVPVHVIPNGIRRDAQAKTKYQDRPKIASTVARVAAQKNPYLWSEVARILGTTGPELDLHWWGPSSVDVASEDVFGTDKLAGSRGRYLGPTQDPISVLASSDLLFHTADREAHSIGILEAAAVGLPVVCSASVAKTLPEEVVVVPFNDGDADSAVAALQSVVDTWPSMAKRAMDASPLVRERFSIDHCARTYVSLFTDLATTTRGERLFQSLAAWAPDAFSSTLGVVRERNKRATGR
ncbi:glycosyltransferase [Pseudarthrobacter quantipunctorum]|uniref:glycosyltransferase n=1 Tax=Pseudarthrobacter quantipunctorum TaxID=3128980 RepID=UPI003872DC1B